MSITVLGSSETLLLLEVAGLDSLADSTAALYYKPRVIGQLLTITLLSPLLRLNFCCLEANSLGPHLSSRPSFSWEWRKHSCSDVLMFFLHSTSA